MGARQDNASLPARPSCPLPISLAEPSAARAGRPLTVS
jgi:hypothetical protein